MTDRITLTGLRATGHHGVFEHERVDGQEFIVDITVHVDLRDLGDDLSRTVHYGELAEGVVAAIERDPVDLIETLAERIAAVALGFPATQAVDVIVHKPHAPITVPFDDVTVSISRSR